MKAFPCKFILMIMALIAVFCIPSAAFAETSGRNDQNEGDPFTLFLEKAAGRYLVPTEEGVTVLELIPAFGRLFASVGSYMGEGSLYAYYAAELIPFCRAYPEENCQQSGSAYDFSVRLFSNMSAAGNYWPGVTRQRLTLVPGGVYLSNYDGDGDALISKSNVLLHENDHLPEMMPYGPDDAAGMFGFSGKMGSSGSITGTWTAEYQAEDGKYTLRMSLEAGGMAVFLRDSDTGYPPLLLKGGYVLSGDNGPATFCYLMSSPSSGTMPYTGCVFLETDAEMLVFRDRLPERDELLVPYAFDHMTFERSR